MIVNDEPNAQPNSAAYTPSGNADEAIEAAVVEVAAALGVDDDWRPRETVFGAVVIGEHAHLADEGDDGVTGMVRLEGLVSL
jgi:hypothetical protein